MKIVYLPFDITTAEVKDLIEIDSIEYLLGEGSIEVIEYGGGSFTSNFSCSYAIRFIGDFFCRCDHQMSSDFSLEG